MVPRHRVISMMRLASNSPGGASEMGKSAESRSAVALSSGTLRTITRSCVRSAPMSSRVAASRRSGARDAPTSAMDEPRGGMSEGVIARRLLEMERRRVENGARTLLGGGMRPLGGGWLLGELRGIEGGMAVLGGGG